MWNLVDSDSTTIIVDVKLSRQWQYRLLSSMWNLVDSDSTTIIVDVKLSRQWQYDYYRRCET